PGWWLPNLTALLIAPRVIGWPPTRSVLRDPSPSRFRILPSVSQKLTRKVLATTILAAQPLHLINSDARQIAAPARLSPEGIPALAAQCTLMAERCVPVPS